MSTSHRVQGARKGSVLLALLPKIFLSHSLSPFFFFTSLTVLPRLGLNLRPYSLSLPSSWDTSVRQYSGSGFPMSFVYMSVLPAFMSMYHMHVWHS